MMKTISTATTAVAVLGLTVGAAVADSRTYSVTVGGDSGSAQRAFVALSDGPLEFAMEKPAGGYLTMGCPTASVPESASSYVAAGSHVVDLVTIDPVRFTSCTGPGGASAVTSQGRWVVKGVSSATSATTDIVDLRVDNVTFRYSQAICRFTAMGSLDGRFDEATQKLTIDEQADGTGGEATVTEVVGCLGQVKRGGRFKLSGTFSTNTEGGAVNVRG